MNNKKISKKTSNQNTRDVSGNFNMNEAELLGEDEEKLILMIQTLREKKKDLNNALLKLENALYYKEMLKEGRTRADVLNDIEQDKQMLKRASDYKRTFNGLRNTFFGYPGNLNSDSPTVRKLRKKESGMFYVNNSGDPYEKANASMDGKEFEREILRLFYRKFEIDEGKGWGYVTTGGSESNSWGILNGFRKFPNGRLYFCEAAHYSVEKTVSNGGMKVYPYTILPQVSSVSEKANKLELIETVRRNYRAGGEPAILLLTWGTTKFGSIDEVEEITGALNGEAIPYYLHVDAAFFGGIPNNQIDAPVCPTLRELGADSISVSLHKFFGLPTINSVVLAKDKATGREIGYLGTRDTTISGSRTFPVFSALQRIKEVLERSPDDYYIRNVRYLEDRMKEGSLKYIRDGKSNIFVIPCPSDGILKRFQLPSFNEVAGRPSLAHIIVNPFHSKQEIDEIYKSISMDQKSMFSTRAPWPGNQ